MKDQPQIEYLPVVGAGGINSSMPDLCKFGNSFLTYSALSRESCDEMAKNYAVSVPAVVPSFGFGLGWDNVGMKNAVCDLGEGVLLKSGGTSQFLSFLVVSPKYNLVGAISGTTDTGTDHLVLINR